MSESNGHSKHLVKYPVNTIVFAFLLGFGFCWFFFQHSGRYQAIVAGQLMVLDTQTGHIYTAGDDWDATNWPRPK